MANILRVDIAALVISALAFIVSAWAVVYARSQAQSAKKMALIEERRHNLELEQVEQERVALLTADLGIAVGPPVANEDPKLYVHNRGRHAARNVGLSLAAVRGEVPMFRAGVDELALSDLAPSDSDFVHLVTDYETATDITANLRWTDGLGDHASVTPLNLLR